MTVVDRFNEIKARMEKAAGDVKRRDHAELVVVTKTFAAEDITPVLEIGHRIYGENRVQEAQGKWPDLKARYPGIELHLIGPLQSNKAGEAVALFDVIETVDREKIARALKAEMDKQQRSLRVYVQVNTGLEPQKAGIAPNETTAFVDLCRKELGLAVEGLMCIPPADENPGPHFALLANLAGKCGLEKLSMGMSGDFEIAVAFGATSVRVGSAIFGSR
jgi:pyridoxal phosphate enzyme (YggS family)